MLDLLWFLTMRSVWGGKPAKNATEWKAFNNVRGVVLFLSFVNIAIKGVAVGVLVVIHRGAGQIKRGQAGVAR